MILHTGLTYSEANAKEKEEATARGCYNQAGGGYVDGRVWSVYYVSGGTVPTD